MGEWLGKKAKRGERIRREKEEEEEKKKKKKEELLNGDEAGTMGGA